MESKYILFSLYILVDMSHMTHQVKISSSLLNLALSNIYLWNRLLISLINMKIHVVLAPLCGNLMSANVLKAAPGWPVQPVGPSTGPYSGPDIDKNRSRL